MDNVSKEKRSNTMKAVKSKNTKLLFLLIHVSGMDVRYTGGYLNQTLNFGIIK